MPTWNERKERNRQRSEALDAKRAADPSLDATLTYLSRIEKNTSHAADALSTIKLMLFVFFLILLIRGFLSAISY